MESLVSFEKWLELLKSDEIWLGYASMHHKPETFEKCARKVYMQYIADGVIKPITEARKHVYNILAPIPGDKVKVDWINKSLEKQKVEEKANEAPPVSWEKRAEYLQKIQDILKGSQMMSSVPRVGPKEAAEQGDWLPPKGEPYPTTSAKELYIRQRHLAYISYAYDARTAQPLDTWIEEKTFNHLYDEKETNKLEKKVYKTLKA